MALCGFCMLNLRILEGREETIRGCSCLMGVSIKLASDSSSAEVLIGVEVECVFDGLVLLKRFGLSQLLRFSFLMGTFVDSPPSVGVPVDRFKPLELVRLSALSGMAGGESTTVNRAILRNQNQFFCSSGNQNSARDKSFHSTWPLYVSVQRYIYLSQIDYTLAEPLILL